MASTSEEGETTPSPDDTFAVLGNYSRPDKVPPINRYDLRTLLAPHPGDRLQPEICESHLGSLVSSNRLIASPARDSPVLSPHRRNNLRSDFGSRVQPALCMEVIHA